MFLAAPVSGLTDWWFWTNVSLSLACLFVLYWFSPQCSECNMEWNTWWRCNAECVHSVHNVQCTTVQCTVYTVYSVHCAMQGRVESGRSEDSWTPWIHPWMDAARHSGQRLEGGWSSGFGSALVMLVMVEMIMFPVRHFKEVLFVNLLRKRQPVQSLVAVGEVRQRSGKIFTDSGQKYWRPWWWRWQEDY